MTIQDMEVQNNLTGGQDWAYGLKVHNYDDKRNGMERILSEEPNIENGENRLRLKRATDVRNQHTNFRTESDTLIDNKSKQLSFSIDKILSTEMQPKRDWMIETNYAMPGHSYPTLILNPYFAERNHSNSCKKCGMLDHDMSYGHSTDIHSYPQFDWLNCTRYNPPKITRAKRRQSFTERSSRQPRIPFTPFQQATLEKQFQANQYLTTALLTTLAHALKLSKQRIKVWYQNRRARDRREEQSKSDEC